MDSVRLRSTGNMFLTVLTICKLKPASRVSATGIFPLSKKIAGQGACSQVMLVKPFQFKPVFIYLWERKVRLEECQFLRVFTCLKLSDSRKAETKKDDT